MLFPPHLLIPCLSDKEACSGAAIGRLSLQHCCFTKTGMYACVNQYTIYKLKFKFNGCYPTFRQTKYKSYVTALYCMPSSSAAINCLTCLTCQWWKSDDTWEAKTVVSLLQNCNYRSSCRAAYSIWNSSHSPAVGRRLEQTGRYHMQEVQKWRRVTASFLVLEHANWCIWSLKL